MKNLVVVTCLACFIPVFYSLPGQAQAIPSPVIEQEVENLTGALQSDIEDDAWLEQMARFKKEPLDLNLADENDLREFNILTDLQISNFISYRKLLGKLIDLYELQAVPGWDLFTIKKIVPFVILGKAVTATADFKNRIHNGDHSLLFRISQVLEKPEGYAPVVSGNYYPGSPQRLFFRYRYQYKNLLQYGLLGDKDAGEQFFRGAQSRGFDFYSLHLFLQKAGIVQSLALGDYTVNLGQGLIQWQSLAFRKGINITGIKRQSRVLQPYHSAGEYNFHRGAGVTLRIAHWELTLFGSFRRLNTNQEKDTSGGGNYFSSFLTSGYNRTRAELENRNNLSQTVSGGNLAWSKNRLHIGINGIVYHFSLPLQKRPEPYNLYAWDGRRWANGSIDYSYGDRNFHVFGELATDKENHAAFVNGLILSVNPKADLSLLVRSFSKKYQSVNGNAFAENSNPSNEDGFYAGCSLRPVQFVRLDLYADFYRFPWLKYGVDAPSQGRDFFIQLTYTPNKLVEIYSRYHQETRQLNRVPGITVMDSLETIPVKNWRTQISCRLSKAVNLKSRVELAWYDRNGPALESGFLGFLDFVYNPPLKSYGGSVRVQFYETTGYNARLYAYENDVLASYSIPAFSGKGFRYYINLNYDLTKHISIWIKWSQSIIKDEDSLGSGLDKIGGNTKSEARFQFVLYL